MVDHSLPFNLSTSIRLEPPPFRCELRTTTTKLVLLFSFKNTFLSLFLYYNISFSRSNIIISILFLPSFVYTSFSFYREEMVLHVGHVAHMQRGSCMCAIWCTCSTFDGLNHIILLQMKTRHIFIYIISIG